MRRKRYNVIKHNIEFNNSSEGWWCIISGHKIYMPAPHQHIPFGLHSDLHLPFAVSPVVHQIGEFEGNPVYTFEVDKQFAESGDFHSLRFVLHSQNDFFEYAARAFQVLHFLDTHQYCGRCGKNMDVIDWELATFCKSCNHRCYPRISPCIIVAIRNDDKLLLAKGKHSTSGMYSVLAGFVESGETLEQAVHREVMEEVGIEIKNLKYFGSQPWPFPHSLMMGYTAEYAGGELTICEAEILAADWFRVGDMPETPSIKSISGQLIAHTVKMIQSGR